jgi:hypothetical protein
MDMFAILSHDVLVKSAKIMAACRIDKLTDGLRYDNANNMDRTLRSENVLVSNNIEPCQ